MARACRVGGVEIGAGRPLAVIAGPCVLESRALGLEVGRRVRSVCDELGLAYVFKASFDKANRTSAGSGRGPGIARGLDDLASIRDTLGTPVTTDIHEPDHANDVGHVADLIQIPAFLCRQTDLLVAAGVVAVERRLAVNVKKGQFLSPREMAGPVRKLGDAGCDDVLLTERGTFFGYHRLVNDFTGIGDLLDADPCDNARAFVPDFGPAGPPPLCFDATHSCQLPGAGSQSGGRRERCALLARAAVAAGVHALFLEVHPDPANALSDGATQLTPEAAERVIRDCAAIRHALASDTATP